MKQLLTLRELKLPTRRAENGHLDVVELLLNDPRVDPSAQNNKALRRAKKNNYQEVVELLLKDPRVLPPIRRRA